MRLMFADMYTEEEKGIRTKKIVDLLAKKISELEFLFLLLYTYQQT